MNISRAFYYDDTKSGCELKIHGFSLMELLSLLSPSTTIDLKSLGATCYRTYGWATQQDLPLIETVGELVSFLKNEGDIGIIELELELNGCGVLYGTSEDLCIVFVSRSFCLNLLKKMISPSEQGAFINRLLNNPGRYFAAEG